MKRKNPIDQSKLIENEYRDYLKSEFNLADEKLKEKFEDLYQEVADKYKNVVEETKEMISENK